MSNKVFRQEDYAMTTQTIAGGEAASVILEKHHCLRVTNTEGAQVVDIWAFNRADTTEFLSTEHTRSCLERLSPRRGDSVYSNKRRAMLTITEDTSPGVHDLLLSACDQARYTLLGHPEPHRSCADNFWQQAGRLNLEVDRIPSPFNLFENVRIATDGALTIEPPLVAAGQSTTLRAEFACQLILSVCPMDIALTNGPDGRSKPVDIEVLGD